MPVVGFAVPDTTAGWSTSWPSEDAATGHIRPAGPRFTIAALANLADPSAIRQQLTRIQAAVIDDPGLAIGGAKEPIESTAKVVRTIR